MLGRGKRSRRMISAEWETRSTAILNGLKWFKNDELRSGPASFAIVFVLLPAAMLLDVVAIW